VGYDVLPSVVLNALNTCRLSSHRPHLFLPEVLSLSLTLFYRGSLTVRVSDMYGIAADFPANSDMAEKCILAAGITAARCT
jgi:hypothetical protein